MAECIVFDDTTAALIEDMERGYVLFTCREDSAKDIPHYNYSVVATDPGNAGFDLAAAESWCGLSGDSAHLLDLGVKAMLVDIVTRKPVHYWLLPRSSIYKTGHMMANSVGVIDSSYRGVLKAPVINTLAVGMNPPGFKRGERYFQIVAPDMGPIHVVRAVGSLPETRRGEGGFGSTGQ
jgi:deoxyuridine 5'-triphosphate nucleotidohydrolase